MEFRKLRANEIDCRISTINQKGLSLLLYKDARVDQRILDETVGAENWQRSHEVINGNLFCNVGIRIDRGNTSEWVWKQDVGTESYTEKEKGEASDSFKRACFNWGIGRELYSAPFIWITPNNCNIQQSQNGKLTCYDRFKVVTIDYDDDGNISQLTIVNAKTGNEVYSLGGKGNYTNSKYITKEEADTLAKDLMAANVNINKLLDQYKVTDLDKLTPEQMMNIYGKLG